MPPLVAHAFWPLSTHSPVASSYFARVRMPETSEPAFGSEAQNAATAGSSTRAEALRDPECPSARACPGRRSRRRPATVPISAMPIPASPQKSSSLTIGSVRPVGSAKNWAMPSKP